MKNVEDIYPLSPLQSGMLFHAVKEPGSGAYFEQYYCRFKGDFKPGLYRQAWQSVVERHRVLRTAFVWEELDQPLQVVRQKVDLDWQEEDLRQVSDQPYTKWLASHLKEDRAIGFDLSKAPLMRFRLFRLGEDDYQWFWSYHHILSDGWSTAIILDEVTRAYRHLWEGRRSSFGSPPAAYRNFIAWLQERDLSQAEKFWKEKLKGFSEPATMALPRPTYFRSGHQQVEKSLPALLTTDLERVSKQQRITLNTFVQGAWAVLHHRYGSDDDIMFGSTVSGRSAPLEGIESMVGLFINTLPVRVNVEAQMPFNRWLRKLQVDEMEARQYEHTALSKIQSWSQIPPGSPMFDSIVVFENYPRRDASDPSLPEVEVEDSHYKAHSNYPLAFIVIPDRAMRLIIVYDRSRFSDSAIDRIFGHFTSLCRSFVEDPARPITELSILTGPEKILLRQWQTESTYAGDPPGVDLQFETRAAKHPERTAVTCGRQQISYGDLNRRAHQLAHYLRHKGFGRGARVGIYLHRSIDMIAAIFGVIKSGAAYVPLDPSYPSGRLAYMIADAQITAVITQQSMAPDLPAEATTRLYMDEDAPWHSKEWLNGPAEGPKPQDPAYIIYTSGSTGKPKGVMINHGNLAHATRARLNYYQKRPERFLLLSSISFDSSIAGIFGTLCRGGDLHIPDPRRFRDIDYLTGLINHRQITRMLCIPSLYQQMLQAYESRLHALETVVVAGEPCPPLLVARHFEVLKQTELYNEYGPTEATVWSTVHRCTPNDASKGVPIGRPIENTRIVILDRHRQPVPAGIPGEIFIAGPGLAQGYLNQEQLTAQRFVSIAVDGKPPERFYQTGDQGYYSPLGQIMFLGRKDRQAKIRGYRIELDEISAICNDHPDVLESATIIHQDRHDRSYIASYVVAGQPHKELIPRLRDTLRSKLPDFMVPRNITVIDQMPLTVNGKLDHRALLAMGRKIDLKDTAYTAPRNQLEADLASLWAKHLDLERVGVTDNYFESGGDSLLALKLITDIQREIGKEIKIASLFRNPTIVQLAKAMTRRHSPGKSHLIVPVQPKGSNFPMFMFHGTDQMHRYLHDDQPLYRFLSLYDDILLPYKANTIENMAALNIRHLREDFPRGPYVFCGFSAGAVVAIEMARQLSQKHNELSFLFLLEPTWPSRHHISRPENAEAFSGPKRSRVKRVLDKIRENPAYAMKIAVQKAVKRMRLPMFVLYGVFKAFRKMGLSVPRKWRLSYARRLYEKAAALYEYQPYVGPGTLCFTKSYPDISVWESIFIGDLDIYQVEGARTHQDLTRNKNIIKSWVNYMNHFLRRIQEAN